MRSGFSLVELSIVLVILGLLTGGILAGQSLIRAAELRAISTEYSRYSAAVNGFRDRYLGLPGDITSAASFWGLDTLNGCSSAAVTSPTWAAGACNGDGNGMLHYQATANGGPVELFQFWKQLADAGLIEGQYTGRSAGNSRNRIMQGEPLNIPRSRFTPNMWLALSPTTYNPSASYEGTTGNMFLIGRLDNILLGSSGAAGLATVLTMKPEEAWNIDTKMDDGKPALGRVRPRVVYWYIPPTNLQGCTTSTSSTDATGEYQVSVSNSSACSLYFLQAF